MNKYCVRIKSHPVWAVIGNLRHQQSQAISQWTIESAEQIGSMNGPEINKAIWQVIWRTIINSIIIIVIISLAIYSGYLQYQFPDPQHLDLLLLAGAISCNVLLTQLLNLKYLKTIFWFVLLLGSLISIAHIAPTFDRMLMYLYTSWLLIFTLPIIYGLTVLAFDLRRFWNILVVITAIVATFFYSLYPIQQFFDWEIEIDFLSIANQVSLTTTIVSLVIFMIFATITKVLKLLPQIGILFLRELAK
jgi:hypothetical protein